MMCQNKNASGIWEITSCYFRGMKTSVTSLAFIPPKNVDMISLCSFLFVSPQQEVLQVIKKWESSDVRRWLKCSVWADSESSKGWDEGEEVRVEGGREQRSGVSVKVNVGWGKKNFFQLSPRWWVSNHHDIRNASSLSALPLELLSISHFDTFVLRFYLLHAPPPPLLPCACLEISLFFHSSITLQSL